jgi:hypothetical protein
MLLANRAHHKGRPHDDFGGNFNKLVEWRKDVVSIGAAAEPRFLQP